MFYHGVARMRKPARAPGARLASQPGPGHPDRVSPQRPDQRTGCGGPRLPPGTRRLAFAPGAAQAAAVLPTGSALGLDLATGETLWHHPGAFSDLALSPDGARVALAGFEGVTVLAAGSGAVELEAQLPPTLRVAWARRGAALVADHGPLVVLDAHTGQPVRHLDLVGTPRALAFSADGRFLYAMSDRSLVRLDLRRGERRAAQGLTFLPGGLHGLQALAVHLDGRVALASGSVAQAGARLHLLQGRDLRQASTLELPRPEGSALNPPALAFDDAGDRVLVARYDGGLALASIQADGQLRLTETLAATTPRAAFPAEVLLGRTPPYLEAQGPGRWRLGAVRPAEVELAPLRSTPAASWTPPAGGPLADLPPPLDAPFRQRKEALVSAARHPADPVVALGYVGGALLLADLETGETLDALPGPTMDCDQLTASPAGDLLAASPLGGRVQLWGPELEPLAPRTVSSWTLGGLSVSPDGAWIHWWTGARCPQGLNHGWFPPRALDAEEDPDEDDGETRRTHLEVVGVLDGREGLYLVTPTALQRLGATGELERSWTRPDAHLPTLDREGRVWRIDGRGALRIADDLPPPEPTDAEGFHLAPLPGPAARVLAWGCPGASPWAWSPGEGRSTPTGLPPPAGPRAAAASPDGSWAACVTLRGGGRHSLVRRDLDTSAQVEADLEALPPTARQVQLTAAEDGAELLVTWVVQDQDGFRQVLHGLMLESAGLAPLRTLRPATRSYGPPDHLGLRGGSAGRALATRDELGWHAARPGLLSGWTGKVSWTQEATRAVPEDRVIDALLAVDGAARRGLVRTRARAFLDPAQAAPRLEWLAADPQQPPQVLAEEAFQLGAFDQTSGRWAAATEAGAILAGLDGDGDPVALCCRPAACSALAFTAGGRWLVAACGDGTLAGFDLGAPER